MLAFERFTDGSVLFVTSKFQHFDAPANSSQPLQSHAEVMHTIESSGPAGGHASF